MKLSINQIVTLIIMKNIGKSKQNIFFFTIQTKISSNRTSKYKPKNQVLEYLITRLAFLIGILSLGTRRYTNKTTTRQFKD